MKRNKLKENRFWTCVIGPATEKELEHVHDSNLQVPVAIAFSNSIGRDAELCHSGWHSSSEFIAEENLKQSSIYVVRQTCSPTSKKVELTRGELLKLMTNLAKEYAVFAVDSLKRNGHAVHRPNQDTVNDVLTDFLNFAAGQYGMDYGLKPWHLREENENVPKIR